GTINDVRRAAKMAHSLGAQIFVDAVHYAPHGLIDARDWDCDFLACSAYKFYGPHIGILYGRHDLLDSLDFPKLIPAPDSAPERARSEEHTSELQSRFDPVCRLLLENNTLVQSLRQHDPLGLGRRLHRGERRLHDRRDHDRTRLEVQSARDAPRHIEEVLDEAYLRAV